MIVAVPEAEPVVGSFRAALDSGAAVGVPAHITIFYPFLPANDLSADVIGQLRDLFGAVDAFEISLASIGWFDDAVVFIRPDPDTALRRMTALVAERWPQWPPYGGAHPDPTPHLTIADNGDLPAMSHAAQAVQRSLPLHIDVSEVQLHAGIAEPGTWHHRLTFALNTQHL